MGNGYSPEQIVRKLREAEGKLSGQKDGSSGQPRTLSEKLLQPAQQPDLLLSLRSFLVDLREPPLEHPTVLFDPLAPLLELQRVNYLGLVGIDEPAITRG